MKHQYLLELGGENTDLGRIEALELLSTENYNPKLVLDEASIITIEEGARFDGMCNMVQKNQDN